MKKKTRAIVGLITAAFFIWLISKGLDFQELKTVFRQADISYIVAAVALFFIGYSCRIERWRLMLLQENSDLRWRDCAGPLMASVAANNVLPFRAGDIIRGFGFNKRLSISASTSLTSLVVERMLDLLMVVSFLGAALIYFGTDSSRFIGIGGSALVVGAAVILFLLLFPHIFKSPALWVGRILCNSHPRLGEKLTAQFEKIFSILGHTSKSSVMIRLVAWSFGAWVAEGLVFWLVALSLPAVSQHIAAWVALSVGTLATIIPSTPGYVGTFDYFTAKSMIVMGNSVGSSTAFALIVHAVLWLPPTLVGGIYLLVNPLKQSKESKEVING